MINQEKPARHSHKWWRTPLRFLLETLAGVAIFLIIGAAAVGLSLIVGYLKSQNVDPLITSGLKVAEYGVFVVDLSLFARFLWVTAKHTWKAL